MKNTPSVFQERQRTFLFPVEAVWEKILRIEEWPNWHTEFTGMSIEAQPVVGTRFEYTNSGTCIQARVTELQPKARFGFIGRAYGVTAHNEWILTSPSYATTEVVLREEMRGILPWLFRGAFNRKLGDGLDSWLNSLERCLRATH